MTNALVDKLEEIHQAIDGLQPPDYGELPGAHVLDCVGSVLTSNVLDRDPETYYPENGNLPDGFASWQAYFDYKCDAAVWIWETVDRLAAHYISLSGTALQIQGVTAGLSALALTLGLTLPVIGWVAIATGLLSIMVLNNLALDEWGQFRERWLTDKSDIVCGLYTATSAADAATLLGSYMADAIDAIVWPVELVPISVVLAQAFGNVASQLEAFSLANILFVKSSSVPSGGFDCGDCGALCQLVSLQIGHWMEANDYASVLNEANNHQYLWPVYNSNDLGATYCGAMRSVTVTILSGSIGDGHGSGYRFWNQAGALIYGPSDTPPTYPQTCAMFALVGGATAFEVRLSYT